MIIYFADREMNILGQASTDLPEGIHIADDKKTEEIEVGVAVLEFDLYFDDATREKVEEWVKAGNYILRDNEDEQEFFTIIESETDVKKQTVNVYAEDAGMDLLNEIKGEFKADKAYPIQYYIESFAYDSGFEIGVNEISDLSRKLSWEGEATSSARLLSVATQFGAELSYSFEIDKLEVKHKYINIYKQRGEDSGQELRINREIDNIIVKKSVADLATGLTVTGGTPEGKDTPITLNGYKYDDGDFYVSGTRLFSRNALAKWSRYLSESGTDVGHIMQRYTYDTTSQSELCNRAVSKLKSICDMAVTYEVTLAYLPKGIRIGDTVNVVDDAGKLYLSARVMKLEECVEQKKYTATLGDYKAESSGISEKMEQLAAQFETLAKKRTLYQWIAYADDEVGTNISLDPSGKDYMGIASNQVTQNADISDPTVFSWSKIKGDPGKEGATGPQGEKGETGAQGPKGETGATGVGVKSIVEEYYKSTSSTTQTGGSWTTTAPAWSNGTYIWTRSTITYTDNTTKTTTPICVTGAKGSTGSTGATGPQGPQGEKGVTGVGISSVDVLYYLSTSATSLAGGSWVTTPPTWVNGKYMWSKTKTTYTDNTTDETDPVCITGAKGATGAQGPQGATGPQGEKGETGAQGPKGDSTGIIVSSTAPTTKYNGMLWKNTGTGSGLVKGATYRWNGTTWELYKLQAENIEAKNLAAVSSEIGTLKSPFTADISTPTGTHKATGTITVDEGLISGEYTYSDQSSTGLEGSYSQGPDGIKGQAQKVGNGQYAYEYGMNGIKVQNGPWEASLDPGQIKQLEQITVPDEVQGFETLIAHAIGNLMYPVGSIYMSASDTDPGELFGGTWERWGKGRVPVSVDEGDTTFATVEKTGGAKTCTLNETQIPAHTHGIGHTHKTPKTTIASSGAHTHKTTAKDATNPLTVSGTQINWGTAANITTGSTKMSGMHPNGTEKFVLSIPALSIASSGAHTHSVPEMTTSSQSTSTSGETGGGKSHNNIQPYITCYMWKRTA